MQFNKEPKTTFRVYMFNDEARYRDLLYWLMRNLKFAYEANNVGFSWNFQILDAGRYAISIQGNRLGIKLMDKCLRRHFVVDEVLMPTARS